MKAICTFCGKPIDLEKEKAYKEGDDWGLVCAGCYDRLALELDEWGEYGTDTARTGALNMEN